MSVTADADLSLQIVHQRAAGIDISKQRNAKVCLRAPGARAKTYTSTVTTWGATTGQILELRDFLERGHVTTVVMEATSDYWKPFFYLLEDTLPVMLLNAKTARNIPGRKTDVSDAAWLAQLGAHGLLRASFGANGIPRSWQAWPRAPSGPKFPNSSTR